MRGASKKKPVLLGMPSGTATARLRKLVMFSMAQKLDMDICFVCKTKIETVDVFTIEHKKKWERSEDPKATFFDVENIAFSHAKCNRPEISNDYRISDNELLESLRVMSRDFGRTVTSKESRYSRVTYKNRFGSYNRAIELAGLIPNRSKKQS